MNQFASTIFSTFTGLLLVVKFWFVRLSGLKLITPSGVLNADGCGCDTCECKK